MLVRHDRRHAELAQPGAERDAALAAADDQHVRLGGVTELAGLPLPAVQPGLPVPVRAVLDEPHWSALAPVGALRRWRMIEMDDSGGLTAARLRIDERIYWFDGKVFEEL